MMISSTLIYTYVFYQELLISFQVTAAHVVKRRAFFVKGIYTVK